MFIVRVATMSPPDQISVLRHSFLQIGCPTWAVPRELHLGSKIDEPIIYFEETLRGRSRRR
jgi:hypothetical protein